MSLVARLRGNGPNGFGYGSTAEMVTQGLDLRGKCYLVTGCNSGLGQESMRVLAMRGARVLATARSLAKAEAAAAQHPGGHIQPLALDLSDPSSLRACVKQVGRLGHRLDGIIANAGVMALPQLQLCHGIEKQWFTNHVGHFMLITGLLEGLKEDGRVVMVSSTAQFRAPREGIQFNNLDGSKGYQPWVAYGHSKLANLLFAKALAKRFEGSLRTANAVHPGLIHTNLLRHLNPLSHLLMGLAGPLLLKNIPQGAATQVFAATHPSLKAMNGQYLSHCQVAKPSIHAKDAELVEALWMRTEAIVASLP